MAKDPTTGTEKQGGQTHAERQRPGATPKPGQRSYEDMMGAKRDDHITHTIAGPTDVSLEQTDEGADVALAITSEGGAVTLLRFRSPTLPAMVDGIVEEKTRPSV